VDLVPKTFTQTVKYHGIFGGIFLGSFQFPDIQYESFITVQDLLNILGGYFNRGTRQGLIQQGLGSQFFHILEIQLLDTLW
jgi:hypothetical protein